MIDRLKILARHKKPKKTGRVSLLGEDVLEEIDDMETGIKYFVISKNGKTEVIEAGKVSMPVSIKLKSFVI